MEQVATTLLVAIVVVRVGERFVVVEESKAACRGQWSLPGGVVEAGESIAAAAIREAKEEAGIDVEPKAVLAIEHVRYDGERHELYSQKLRFIVLAEALTMQLKQDEDGESKRAKLCTLAEVQQLPLREARCLAWINAALGNAAHLPMNGMHFLSESES